MWDSFKRTYINRFFKSLDKFSEFNAEVSKTAIGTAVRSICAYN